MSRSGRPGTVNGTVRTCGDEFALYCNRTPQERSVVSPASASGPDGAANVNQA
ncbi:hypothetical protein [Actinomadura rupiterrae]|uniref:hypothetical protein n=1 Tax=Actinomadura rupiterrae TaxID=559627 RepID=UPI0020A2579C|nr:hypothetical protein [Actinomadura rupiterrae]MCP2342994.1 hypothetical protein [Actinomadura rupiterrae]